MKYFRRKRTRRPDGTTHRRQIRQEPPLCSANLCSPIFVESWNGGSPLNWVEFMNRWEITRADKPDANTEPDPTLER
jgi:hypothetical protein